MNFTIKHYKKTLESYLSEDYKFCELNESLNFENKFVMVHDVDHDISLCANFSSVEKELDISTTYFLRLHAVKYNMFSKPSIQAAKSLLNNNHNIGLHYEPSFYKNKNHLECIEKELEVLSNILQYEVKYFNIHEPSRSSIDLGNILKEKNRCYDSNYFQGFKYLSDSSCRWREGCFSKHVGKWKKLLVLTHPFWWYHETPSENY